MRDFSLHTLSDLLITIAQEAYLEKCSIWNDIGLHVDAVFVYIIKLKLMAFLQVKQAF